ncbi:hypothetical protein ACS0TY_014043 [Phlomoides rotata]
MDWESSLFLCLESMFKLTGFWLKVIADIVNLSMPPISKVPTQQKAARAGRVNPEKCCRDLIFYNLTGVIPASFDNLIKCLRKLAFKALLDIQYSTPEVTEAESLVKSQQDIGETMGQLGLAFVKQTKFETEEAAHDSQRARAADMKNVSTAAVNASRLYRELNSQTVKHLDKIHEYLGVILAVNNAFSDRSSAFLTVQTLLSDLSSLNSRIEKLEAASSKIFGGDRSRIRKIEELRETVRMTENAKNCAIKEYEQIKGMELGREATVPEVFLKLNYNEDVDEWLNPMRKFTISIRI